MEFSRNEVLELKNDVLEIEKRIIGLIFDSNGRPRYRAHVNRIFKDLFGVDGVGNAFVGEGGRLAMKARFRLYDTIGVETLYTIIVDERRNEYSILQLMVALLKGTDDERSTKDTRLECAKRYNGLLDSLRDEFDIEIIPSVDSIVNPLKLAKRVLRDRDDYGYGGGYGAYYDDYDYGSSRRFKSYDYNRRDRDRDDDYLVYNDSYFERILRGTDYETPRSKKSYSKSSKKKKYSAYNSDDDDDYDRADSDVSESEVTTDAIIEMSNQIETVAKVVKNLQDKVNNQPAPSVSVRESYKGRDDNNHDTMISLIKQVVKTVNKLESKTNDMAETVGALTEHVQNIESDIYEDDPGADIPTISDKVDIDSLLLSNDSPNEAND